jgi:hypothetical protein
MEQKTESFVKLITKNSISAALLHLIGVRWGAFGANPKIFFYGSLQNNI